MRPLKAPKDWQPLGREESAAWIVTQNPPADPHPDFTIIKTHLVRQTVGSQTVNEPPFPTHEAALAWCIRQEHPESYYVVTNIECVPAGGYDRREKFYDRLRALRRRGQDTELLGPLPEPIPLPPGDYYDLYSAWARLGEEGIRRIVERAAERIFGPPDKQPFTEGGDFSLLPYFLNDRGKCVDPLRLQEHLIAFLTHVLGGPQKYRGRDMYTAHHSHDINSRAFGKFVRHLTTAMQELGVEARWIEEVKSVLMPLERIIVASDARPIAEDMAKVLPQRLPAGE